MKTSLYLVSLRIDLMSRVILKNLPQKVKDDKLRSKFQEIGHVTDIRIIRTKDGFSRHFGYVGFMEGESGQRAVEQFNDTYLEGMKIQVEIAKSFNDPNLPRPWSRFSKGSSAYNKREEKKTPKTPKKIIQDKTESENIKPNPELDEFLSMFDKRSKIQTERLPAVVIDSRDATDSLTDLQYLKTKVSKKIPNDSTSPVLFTVKIIGLPFKSTPNDIKQFFLPILLEDDAIRIIRNKKNRPTGRAYVDFKSRKEMYKALRRNGEYMQDRYIELFQDTLNNETHQSMVREQQDDTADLLLEHGRLFIRNLSYNVTEADIQDLFSQYGALSETYLPTDPVTQCSVGFGFVTFMFSENACQALSELDASIFMGRILHIIPAEPRPEKETMDEGKKPTSYKDKKNQEIKSQANSSHNWNTLFLGTNAVAEAISEKYGVTKRKVLDSNTSSSLAVRMALAETEIVRDTKEFLEKQGINMEMLSSPDVKIQRSKSVILVKNLPFGTTAEELDILFSPFGTLDRVVIPRYGITGVVEYLSESQAKVAFSKLAYSKFKHLPLYLEWAPHGLFSQKSNTTDVQDLNGETIQYTIYVKNLNFATQDKTLEKVFEEFNPVQVSISRKRNPNNPKEMQSMGFGFVKFGDFNSAKQAIIDKQGFLVDEHKLEISLAKQPKRKEMPMPKKHVVTTPNENAANVLVIKNIPFEASKKEVYALLSRFGAIRSLRLPKKVKTRDNTTHRGFCFVEFISKEDASLAFDALKSSTHLYGRRLILEYATDENDIERLRIKTKQQFIENTVESSSKSKVELDY